MKTKLFAVLAVTSMMMAACGKDDVVEAVPTVNDPRAFSVVKEGDNYKVNNLPADTIVGLDAIGRPFGKNTFSFFSLETNKWLPNSDSNSTKWDLAFAGSAIRVNNVTSGPGAGGAFVWQGIYNDLKTIPNDSTFRVDNYPISYAIPRGSTRAWYIYDGPNNISTIIPGRVLVIRTASGKYAKVEILNFYRGGVTPSASASDQIKIYDQRFFTFRYQFQPDGSKNFK